jgi:Sulfotransferase domain
MSVVRPLILCIGLNKTGTTSLHDALTILGYRSLHWGGPGTRALVRQAIAEGRPMLDLLDPDVEAVSDLEEVTYNFDLADRQYPGARFILTVRDLDDWLDSRRRHVLRNREAKAAGKYSGGFLEIDLDEWENDYREHERRVRDHFAGRPDDLLVLDIPGGDRWEPLCEFLCRPVPDAPFPNRNRDHPWTEADGARGYVSPAAPEASAQRTE